jgi:hypothetical protein
MPPVSKMDSWASGYSDGRAAEFWSSVRSGMVVAEAAASVGVSITVAWRWFRHVGGVMPEPFAGDKSVVGARRLSFHEREEISCRRAAGEGVRAIA